MKKRYLLAALASVVVAQSDVYGLTPPSKDDGPVKLLNCIVDTHGILEVEVVNETDDNMDCNIRCNYLIGGSTFTHYFDVAIRKRMQGKVGRFNTGEGQAGNFSGEVGTCTKSPG